LVGKLLRGANTSKIEDADLWRYDKDLTGIRPVRSLSSIPVIVVLLQYIGETIGQNPPAKAFCLKIIRAVSSMEYLLRLSI
jgi:hypothetical protein